MTVPSATQEHAEGPGSRLAALLAPDGPVAQGVKREPSVDRLRNPDSETLRWLLPSQVQTLRRDFCPGPGDNPHYRRDPAYSLLDLSNGRNAVLHFLLASHAGLDDCADRLRGRAGEHYLKNRDVYDAVFDGLLPQAFLQEVDAALACSVYARGGNATAAADWPVYKDRRAKRQQSPPGISTGLPGVDETLGGLRGLAFLAGAPGIGKSCFAQAVVLNALRSDPDLAVLYCCLDQPKDILYDRLACAEAMIDYRTLTAPERPPATEESLAAAEERLLGGGLDRLRVIEDVFTDAEGGPDTHPLTQACRELCEVADPRRLLVVIDHFGCLPLQLNVATDLDADRCRLRLIQTFQGANRSPAHPAGPPFLVIAQTPKHSGTTGLTTADLLGSSDLAYAADIIMFLEPDPQAIPPAGEFAPLLLRIAKGRDGARRTTIPLTFDYIRYRFAEAKPQPATTNSRKPRTARSSTGERRRHGHGLAGNPED